jgi:hypothetical protein
MKNLQEVEAYIKEQALKHRSADEDFKADFIELDTGRAILAFALGEGVVFDETSVQIVMNGASEDEEFTTWHYLYELLERLEAMEGENSLPPQTKYLYQLWQREFWGAEDE